MELILQRLQRLSAKYGLASDHQHQLTLFEALAAAFDSTKALPPPRVINRALVVQHRVFVHVMEMIVDLDLKGVKMSKLFPSSTAFFVSLVSTKQATQVPESPAKQPEAEQLLDFLLSSPLLLLFLLIYFLLIYQITSEVAKTRKEFLARIVPHRYEDALKLADSLKIDKDPLYIMQTLLLYARGEDAAGNELTRKIRETKQLTAGLMDIARQRFATILRDSSAHPKLKSVLSLISPEVYEWAMGFFTGSTSLPKPNPVHYCFLCLFLFLPFSSFSLSLSNRIPLF